jgi:hypothetical protein
MYLSIYEQGVYQEEKMILDRRIHGNLIVEEGRGAREMSKY